MPVNRVIEVRAPEPNVLVWEEDARGALPLVLYDRGSLGPTTLVWLRRLDAGRVRMRLVFATGIERRDFILRVNHREQAFHSGYYTHEGGGEPLACEFEVVLPHAGIHRFEIDRSIATFFPLEYALELLEWSIERVPMRDVAVPGAAQAPALVPCWGWHASSTYQRFDSWKITADYWRKRILEQAAKWGANYLQAFPDFSEGFFQDISPGEAIRMAHEAGFYVDTHNHGPTLVGDSLEDRFERLDRYLALYFDLTQRPLLECPDSWETEQYHEWDQLRLGTQENVIRSNEVTWRYHPGCTMGDCKSEPGECGVYHQWLHEDFHGPNYAKVMMCAGGWALCGYDDMDVISLFPKERGFKNQFNWVTRGYQANARPYSTNFYGGTSQADWMAKEIGDYARLEAQARRERRYSPVTALSWLGEGNLTLPEELRRFVLAASMDPCRAALTYPLVTTGFDGELAWRKTFFKQCGNVVGYRPREWAPNTTARLHNSVLGLDSSALSDRVCLRWDSEGLGEFDLNARTLTLSEQLVAAHLGPAPEVVADRTFPGASWDQEFWTPSLPPGTYELVLSAPKGGHFALEAYAGTLYLGRFVGMDAPAETRLPFYVHPGDEYEPKLELRRASDEPLPTITAQVLPTFLEAATLVQLSPEEDMSEHIEPAEGDLPARCVVDLAKDEACPRHIGGDSPGSPRVLDAYFDSGPAAYLLVLRVRSPKGLARVDITLDSHFQNQPGYRAKGAPTGSTNEWMGRPGELGCIHAFDAAADWQTVYVPVVCTHDGGERRHKIELSVPAESPPVELGRLALVRTPVQHRYVQPGGHEAILEQTFTIRRSGTLLHERRTWCMAAEEPVLWLSIERRTEGNAEAASYTGGGPYDAVAPIGEDGGSLHFRATDARNKVLPPMSIHFFGGCQADLQNTHIEIRPTAERFRMAFTLRQDAPAHYYVTPHDTVTLPARGLEAENSETYAQVRRFEILNPKPGPYFAEEDGWWTVRGGQPLPESDEAWRRYTEAFDRWALHGHEGPMPEPPCTRDLVRLVLAPGATGRLQAWGFIDGHVRPGYGCQRQVLLRNVSPKGCTVRVVHVHGYVYAPRVEFAENFTGVRLDGAPWAYHDGRTVFLPQQPGDYAIEIESGEPWPLPTLRATAASVKRAVFAEGRLTIETELPAYVFTLPENLRYSVFVAYDPTHFGVAFVEGGECLRTGPQGGIFRLDASQAVILFGKPKN